ncbi:MAG: type II secretion system protein N [Pseudomonadales bacterium]|nr:type II secretion system protein N [Pseudomonadales bacterium]
MKRIGLTIAASFVVFTIVLAFNLPAAWVRSFLPAAVNCGQLSGSVWRGSCAPLTLQGSLPIGTLTWDLSPWRVVTGKLVGPVNLARGELAVSAVLALGLSGDGEISALTARLPLDAAVLPIVPANIRGSMTLDFSKLVLSDGKPIELHGVVEGRNLREVGARPMALGSYSLTFDGPAAADGSLTGQLVDLGGPLAVRGTVRLTMPSGYLIQGTAAARAQAPPQLQRQLEILGPADADGMRQFALEGTY